MDSIHSDLTEIMPHLYISRNSAASKEALMKKRINVVIYVGEIRRVPGVIYCRASVRNVRNFWKTASLIKEYLDKKENVLVSSTNCMSSAPSIVVVYLAFSQVELPLEGNGNRYLRAFNKVETKRNGVRIDRKTRSVLDKVSEIYPRQDEKKVKKPSYNLTKEERILGRVGFIRTDYLAKRVAYSTGGAGVFFFTPDYLTCAITKVFSHPKHGLSVRVVTNHHIFGPMHRLKDEDFVRDPFTIKSSFDDSIETIGEDLSSTNMAGRMYDYQDTRKLTVGETCSLLSKFDGLFGKSRCPPSYKSEKVEYAKNDDIIGYWIFEFPNSRSKYSDLPDFRDYIKEITKNQANKVMNLKTEEYKSRSAEDIVRNERQLFDGLVMCGECCVALKPSDLIDVHQFPEGDGLMLDFEVPRCFQSRFSGLPKVEFPKCNPDEENKSVIGYMIGNSLASFEEIPKKMKMGACWRRSGYFKTLHDFLEGKVEEIEDVGDIIRKDEISLEFLSGLPHILEEVNQCIELYFRITSKRILPLEGEMQNMFCFVDLWNSDDEDGKEEEKEEEEKEECEGEEDDEKDLESKEKEQEEEESEENEEEGLKKKMQKVKDRFNDLCSELIASTSKFVRYAKKYGDYRAQNSTKKTLEKTKRKKKPVISLAVLLDYWNDLLHRRHDFLKTCWGEFGRILAGRKNIKHILSKSKWEELFTAYDSVSLKMMDIWGIHIYKEKKELSIDKSTEKTSFDKKVIEIAVSVTGIQEWSRYVKGRDCIKDLYLSHLQTIFDYGTMSTKARPILLRSSLSTKNLKNSKMIKKYWKKEKKLKGMNTKYENYGLFHGISAPGDSSSLIVLKREEEFGRDQAFPISDFFNFDVEEIEELKYEQKEKDDVIVVAGFNCGGGSTARFGFPLNFFLDTRKMSWQKFYDETLAQYGAKDVDQK